MGKISLQEGRRLIEDDKNKRNKGCGKILNYIHGWLYNTCGQITIDRKWHYCKKCGGDEEF